MATGQFGAAPRETHCQVAATPIAPGCRVRLIFTIVTKSGPPRRRQVFVINHASLNH